MAVSGEVPVVDLAPVLAEAVVKVQGRAGIEEIAETGEAIVAATEVAIGVVTGALRVHQRSTSRS